MSMHQMQGPGGGGPKHPQAYRTGLGFFPSSIGRYPDDPIMELLRSAPKIPRGICATSSLTKDFLDSGANIPLINIQDIVRAGPAEKQRLIQALGIGISQTGFIGIHAESLTMLFEKLYKEMGRYFHQPFEDKIYDWTPYTAHEGYSFRGCYALSKNAKSLNNVKDKNQSVTSNQSNPANQSVTSNQSNPSNSSHQSTATKKPQQLKHYSPDLKELFTVTPQFSRWPRNFPHLERGTRELQNILGQYATILMQFLMNYLQEEMPPFDQNSQKLRLIHHAMMKPIDDPQALWEAPHIDGNALTILSPGSIPGLQIQSKNQQWHSVIVPNGYLIACIGKQLENKTAGIFKARCHRVVNPGGSFTRLERFSTAFHASWGPNQSLAPFPNCALLATRNMNKKESESYLKRYPSILVSEMR